LVALTEGAVYPRNDIWNGRRRKAPDTPPIEVKKEIAKATSGGTQGATSIPAVLKNMLFPLGKGIQLNREKDYIFVFK
jgi:hypothetical protein